MGNQSSTYSNTEGDDKATNVRSNEPKYVDYAPIQRKHSTKVERVEQHAYSNRPQVNDETFTNFIQRAKYKIRSMTNIGHHVENRNPAASDVVNTNVDSKSKENESDQFSHFIHNTKKKLRTVTTIGKNKTFKKGNNSGH